MKDVLLMKYHDVGTDSLNGKRHFHDKELEILQIISGDGVMMIKDKLYPLSQGTVFFVCGRDAHYSSPQNPGGYIRNKIVFSEKLLLSLCECLGCTSVLEGLFYNGGCAVKLSSEDERAIDKCFLAVSEAISDGSDIGSMRFASELMRLICTATVKKDVAVSCIKNKISDVIDYINRNLDKKLSLDSVSKSTFVSKYYLCHTFKSTVGMTVIEYITLSRISRAKQLLAQTEDSISDISVAVGFDNFAYFSKVFREYEGTTPGAFRKASQGVNS